MKWKRKIASRDDALPPDLVSQGNKYAPALPLFQQDLLSVAETAKILSLRRSPKETAFLFL